MAPRMSESNSNSVLDTIMKPVHNKRADSVLEFLGIKGDMEKAETADFNGGISSS